MILHLDMDAFFAAVEQLDNPALRGKPVIVGGGKRGVVTTASYEARVFGVHSAMPMAIARSLCPHGVYVPVRGRRYSEISARVMACLRDFSPVVQRASIDEAYIDLAGTERLFGTPDHIAAAIRASVRRVTGGLTCSVGIAPVKFLAKICSDINKPDGVFILRPERVDAFLCSLDVGRLPGVGKSMRESLRRIGITTVAQLRQLSAGFLADRYGKWGQILYDRAMGRDPRPVHENAPAKSEGAERTFARDISDVEELTRHLLTHAEHVGASLRRQGLAGRTITVKIKFSDFRLITRSRTIHSRTNATRTIFETARAILAATRLAMPVRLIGLCVSGFDSRMEQWPLPGLEARQSGSIPQPESLKSEFHAALNSSGLLAPDSEARRMRLDKTLDGLRDRFGVAIIRRGTSRG